MLWAVRWCEHCHGSIRASSSKGAGDPGGLWDWPSRAEGVWLHPRCEAAWYDGHKTEGGEFVRRRDYESAKLRS